MDATSDTKRALIATIADRRDRITAMGVRPDFEMPTFKDDSIDSMREILAGLSAQLKQHTDLEATIDAMSLDDNWSFGEIRIKKDCLAGNCYHCVKVSSATYYMRGQTIRDLLTDHGHPVPNHFAQFDYGC